MRLLWERMEKQSLIETYCQTSKQWSQTNLYHCKYASYQSSSPLYPQRGNLSHKTALGLSNMGRKEVLKLERRGEQLCGGTNALHTQGLKFSYSTTTNTRGGSSKPVELHISRNHTNFLTKETRRRNEKWLRSECLWVW